MDKHILALKTKLLAKVSRNANKHVRIIVNANVLANVRANVGFNVMSNVSDNVRTTIDKKSFTDEQLELAFSNLEQI